MATIHACSHEPVSFSWKSNEQFDSDLRAHDPDWGLRDLEAVSEAAASSGFVLAEIVEMPANNLSLIFKREG
jgi:hypothetical protein